MKVEGIELLLYLISASIYAALIGSLVVGTIYRKLKKLTKLPDPYGSPGTRPIPNWVVGVIEQSIFAPAFALYPRETAIGAFAWLALKMATTWHWDTQSKEQTAWVVDHRSSAYLSLLVGFLSLATAAIVGLAFRALAGGAVGD